MRKNTLLLAVLLLPFLAIGQEEKNFGIKFSGFVKTDVMYDSRQTETFREGHYLLYPKGESLDAEGKDINATPNFNMLSVQTRLIGNITGPDVLKAKASGFIEGEFFGTSDNDVNGFRLRHAYAKLKWEKSELMVGQFWHAMFITSCFPDVVSFNTGAPFQPFTRNPQIRYIQSLGPVNVIATLHSQRDFVDSGPDPAAPAKTLSSSMFLRNAVVPDANLKLEYNVKDEAAKKEFLVGVGGNYKMLKPRMLSDSLYNTDETVSGLSEMFYCKLQFPQVTFKLEGVYGQMLQSMTMLGGYAVKSITDSAKALVDYSPLNTLSVWTEVLTNCKNFQYGIFGGYSKNLGASDEITGPFYARGANIEYLYRVAPRVVYNTGKMRFACEFEYTNAAYMTKDENGNPNMDKKGKVTDSKDIANMRVLLGVYYFF